MAFLNTMSGALPANTSDSTSGVFVDIGYDSGSDVGSNNYDYELSFSNHSSISKRHRNCCPEPLELAFSSGPIDHVYDVSSTATSPTSRSFGSMFSSFHSLKRHSRKLSSLSIFQRRRGSSKTRPSIDTQISSFSNSYSHKGQCHSCPLNGIPCNCFLERYVEYASGGRSIDLPSGCSPAVTELEELARQQHVVCLKLHHSARSERHVNRATRRILATEVKEAYEDQQIEEKYARYIEKQQRRQQEIVTVQDGFEEWYSKSPYELGKAMERVGASARLERPSSLDSIGSLVSPRDVKKVVS